MSLRDGIARRIAGLARQLTGQARHAASAPRQGELESSESFLRSILENAPAIIATIGTDGDVRFINRVLPGLKESDVLGHSVYECLAPESHDAARRCFERVMRTGEPDSYESIGRGPYRGCARYLTRVGAIRSGGKVVALTLFSSDVTEQRRAEEEERRSSEERFRATFNQAAVGIAHVSLEGRWLRLNQRFCDIIGYSQEELQELTFQDITYRPDLQADLENVRQLIAGQIDTYAMEKRYVRKDQSLVWVNLTVSLVRSVRGEPSYFISVAEDITQRKRAEAALDRLLEREQAERRRAALLAEASNTLAGSLDHANILNAVARLLVARVACLAALELLDDEGRLGPDRARVAASTCPELERRFRELGERCAPDERLLMRVLDSGRAVVLAPSGADARAPDGAEQASLLERLKLRSAIVVPLEARRQRLGVLVLGSMRGAFTHDDLALAEQIGQRTALALDNARLYEQAQQAIRAREEFLSIASHELRTPLTPLMLRVQQLLRAHRGAAERGIAASELLPKLESVYAQLVRIHRLIEELLDISQVTEEPMPLAPEEFDLTALIEDIVGRHSDQLRRARCQIVFGAPGSVRGRWDRRALEMIAENLLSNAIKYGAGGAIEVGLEAHDDTVRLRVRDHGIGLAPGDQKRIFQRFGRAVSTRHYGGFGLGLWLTRRNAEAMGGTICVNSRPGEGATFIVELPRVTGSA